MNPKTQTAKLETSNSQLATHVREWERADIPSIQHVAWTTWIASYGSFIPEEDMRAFFDEYYTTETLSHFCHAKFARGFLAELDSATVGFAKTSFNSEERKFYLNSLYILPEYQSKGIGSKLLQACEEFAVLLKADEVWLGVMTQNVSALDWYKRIGFQFVREEPFTMGKTTVQHLIGFRKISNRQDAETPK